MNVKNAPPLEEYGEYELITVIMTQYFPVAIGLAVFLIVLLAPFFYQKWKSDKKSRDSGEKSKS